MTLVPLGMAVAMALFGPQGEPPAFRAEAYIVPFYISVFHGKKPVADLTLANFTIVVDKQIYVPVRFEQDPERPGHYVVSFQPSDEVRDGMVHNVVVKVKKRRSVNASFNFPTTIRKSTAGSRP